VKALLLRLAEDLDPDTLAPLADRLEELGDARAEAVRDMHVTALRHPGLTGTCCRNALAHFPEGPRWRTERVYRWVKAPPVAESAWHLTPSGAREAIAAFPAARRYPAYTRRVTGPHWPTPPA
jgi:hypothetical protein